MWDVLLLRRDEALSASTLRGLELARGLRSGRLLRRSYRFATDPAALARAPVSSVHPLYTTTTWMRSVG